MQTQSASWKRNIAIFLTSQGISLFGSSLVSFAISWHITLQTQSGLYMTLSVLFGFLPTLLLSPFAGVWADRYDRKKLIVLADAAIALSTLVLAVLFMLGYRSIWLLLVVSAIRGLGSAVQTPCVNAMIPDLVPAEHLTRIGGINSTIQSLLNLASPALAGVLLSFADIVPIFFIDIVTASIAIVLMLTRLRIKHVPRPDTLQNGYFAEIREGMSYIRRTKFLLHLFAFLTVLYVCIAPVGFLTPLQAVRTYGPEEWRLSAIEIAFSGGMLAGGLLISIFSGLKNRMVTCGIALVCMGADAILLGLGIPFGLYLAAMLVQGIALVYVNTPAMVTMQEKVDPKYMGRVFSVMSMISSSMMPLGMVLFGPLADVVSVESLLIATGAVIMVISLLATTDKTLIAAGIPTAKPAQE